MVESIRQRIQRDGRTLLRKVFDHLDWMNRGYISGKEIQNSLETIGEKVEAQSPQIEGIMRRFNKDKLNGRISLPEFIEEITPKIPEKAY